MAHALARLVVRIAGLLVPRRIRADWIEEWHAELWHELRRVGGGSGLGTAAGAFRSALAVRRFGRNGRHEVGFTRSGGMMMGRDLGQALRTLGRSPAFTLVAILTLTLGLGATGAIFSVVDSVLIRPLPYPEADRLVTLDHPAPGYGEGTVWGLSVAGYFHFREGMESLDELGAYFQTQANLTEGEPERLSVVRATTPVLRALGARSVVGRTFVDSDDDPGAPMVVALGHGLWVRRFGADPGVVGRSIHLDGTAVPVIGVLEEGFSLPGTEVDLWIPWGLDQEAAAQNSHYVRAVGRLAPGASLSAAADEMARLTGRLPERFPDAYGAAFMAESRFGSRVRSLRDEVVGDVGPALWAVLAGVGLVLVMACANVANLFLVRAESRSRDVAVRAAMGASRGALGRYFVFEGILLAAASALLALGLASLSVDALVALAPPGIPRLEEVRVGALTAGVVVILAVTVGAAFGAFPLLQMRGGALARLLGEGGRGRTAGRRAVRGRSILMVAQVAMAMALLAGSGLMARSFQRLTAVDPGFETSGVLTFRIGLPSESYPDAAAVHDFHRALLDRLASSGAVEVAGAVDALPIAGGHRCITVGLEPEHASGADAAGCPQVRFVSPGYFATLGIELLEGRALDEADNQDRTGAIVASRAMADLLWPGVSALGRGARLWGPGYYRVVGVVDDVRGTGLEGAVEPILYFPLRALQGEGYPPVRDMSYAVRSATGSTTGLLAEVRAVIADLDPRLPVASIRTMDEVLSRSVVRTTFTLLLMVIASAMALLIGVVGMYGVVSYLVAQRRREMGVRMALGADGAQVTGLVLRQALATTVAGLALGLAVTLGGTRFLGSLLYDVSPNDPATLGAVALLLVAVVTLAAWLPARRAARVDPVATLRED